MIYNKDTINNNVSLYVFVFVPKSPSVFRTETEIQYYSPAPKTNYDKWDRNNAVSDKAIIHAVCS